MCIFIGAWNELLLRLSQMGQNPNPLNDIIKLHVSSTSVVNYVIKTMEKENKIYKEQI